MITQEKLLKDLKIVKNKIQQIPSMNSYKKHGKYHTATVKRKFGSWNNALQQCFGEIIKEKDPIRPIVNCLTCKKETNNLKYCSRSCAAKTNNSLFPKHPRKKCLRCLTPTRSKTQHCKKCSTLNRLEKYGEKIISDFSSTYARHKYQNIRQHAHEVAKYHKLKKQCPYCNYTNHSQLCHIKDIGKFDKNTKIKVVNDIKNLIFLCPNHHWDLDHNLLETCKTINTWTA